jgi:hypothetical protein
MGALLGMMLGVGLLLMWRSGSRAPKRTARAKPKWVVTRTAYWCWL